MRGVHVTEAKMQDLRVILTQKCAYSCYYCHRHDDRDVFTSREDVLDCIEAAAASGSTAVELAGGDPLEYPDIARLVRDINCIPNVKRVTLTTNGTRLNRDMVLDLWFSRLDGINVHLDSCNAEVFTRMTGCEQYLNDILSCIWQADARGLPVTVTAVIIDEDGSDAPVMAGLARQSGVTIRFVPVPGKVLDREALTASLRRTIPDLNEDGEYLVSPALRGRLTFGMGVWGAFGMEKCTLLKPGAV